MLFVASLLTAQQLPYFRNHSFNMQTLNPASLSLKEMPDIMIDHRSQWVGFSGAPRISTISGKYMFRQDMGAGAFIMSDTYGISQRLDFNLNYVYLLKTEKFNLSFGLAWTLTQFKLNSSEITIYDADDQSINQNMDDKTWKPDANAGIMISSSKYFAGFSVTQLFKTKYIFFDNTNEVPGLIRNQRHYFITGGYKIGESSSIHNFTPSVNLYFAKSTPFKFDLIASYTYNNSFLASLNLSKGDALVFTAGYKYDRFIFTYSFDFVTSRIRNVSSGAHEICIGMYLTKTDKATGNSSPMF
jgi:type IX secretion system PorP/SprF family membrane protein